MQRVIDDVQSEAVNAAEMKADASGIRSYSCRCSLLPICASWKHCILSISVVSIACVTV